MIPSETGKVTARRWAGFGTFIFVTSGISLRHIPGFNFRLKIYKNLFLFDLNCLKKY